MTCSNGRSAGGSCLGPGGSTFGEIAYAHLARVLQFSLKSSSSQLHRFNYEKPASREAGSLCAAIAHLATQPFDFAHVADGRPSAARSRQRKRRRELKHSRKTRSSGQARKPETRN